MDKISVIVPVYYNADILKETHSTLSGVLAGHSAKFDYEIILVDDGSKDESYRVMQEIAAADNRVKLVKLSKNHGAYVAILSGMNFATGDAVVFLAADLQDPPELIPQMYDEWVLGNKRDLVLCVRQSRTDPFLSKLFSAAFYKIFRALVLPDYPKKGFDMFMINKQQTKILVDMDEKNSHLTVQIIWLGFGKRFLNYHRRERKLGKSRWSFFKRLKLAFDTFFGFSARPLRIASFIGMLTWVPAFLLALYVILRKIIMDAPLFGIPALIAAIFVTGGLILLSIGIVGEYLWRNFDATRKRPTFIVEETKNI
ncbi:MAG: glycosyltransferase family 2 protein [Ignavibacteria bacterium]|nr:glycosyltransferase family 2 protein [Ignavibacteria bacterium]